MSAPLPAPGIRYAHTNLIARDAARLIAFYCDVFGCTPAGPARNYHEPAIDAMTGLRDARITGRHLRLPGHGERGPTLEIFHYDAAPAALPPAISRPGLAHLAFEVPDVGATRALILARGGRDYAERVTLEIPGAGRLDVIYMCDPEDNIVELQRWL